MREASIYCWLPHLLCAFLLLVCRRRLPTPLRVLAWDAQGRVVTTDDMRMRYQHHGWWHDGGV